MKWWKLAVLTVAAVFLVYLSCRLYKSKCGTRASDSFICEKCQPHQMQGDGDSSSDLGIPPPEKSSNVQIEDESSHSVIYPDSIWGSFREKNNDKFNEILHAFGAKGALAPITLHVRDEEGTPIPGAAVRVSFSTSAGLDHDKRIFGKTDEKGVFVAAEYSIWAVGWRVEKDGYYTAYSNLELRAYASVQGWKERRWFRAPFPATAILRKKTPHEMLFRTVEERMPPAGIKMGFDLIDGKPTPPHGDGHVSDVVFYEEVGGPWGLRSTEDRFSSLHIEFPGEGNGVARFKMDEYSDLKSPRFAPEGGYVPEIESVVRVLNRRYSDKDLIPPKNYLVARIRSSISQDGTVTNALYGKIRGYWYVNGRKRLLTFWTWMNEEPDERNLEDDSGRW